MPFERTLEELLLLEAFNDWIDIYHQKFIKPKFDQSLGEGWDVGHGNGYFNPTRRLSCKRFWAQTEHLYYGYVPSRKK